MRRFSEEYILTGIAHAAAQMQKYIIIFIFFRNVNQPVYNEKRTAKITYKEKDDNHGKVLFQSVSF